jgi:hypothetical protein
MILNSIVVSGTLCNHFLRSQDNDSEFNSCEWEDINHLLRSQDGQGIRDQHFAQETIQLLIVLGKFESCLGGEVEF